MLQWRTRWEMVQMFLISALWWSEMQNKHVCHVENRRIVYLYGRLLKENAIRGEWQSMSTLTNLLWWYLQYPQYLTLSASDPCSSHSSPANWALWQGTTQMESKEVTKKQNTSNTFFRKWKTLLLTGFSELWKIHQFYNRIEWSLTFNSKGKFKDEFNLWPRR